MATDQAPFTSTLNLASGDKLRITFRRAISAVRSAPTLTLKVDTPGNELTSHLISAASFNSGIVPFTLIFSRYNLGGAWVAAATADCNHGTHSAGEYSRNGENSAQPAAPLNKTISLFVTPRKFVLVGSAITRILSSNSGNI